MTRKFNLKLWLMVAITAICLSSTASAVPLLQLYIQGSTYDTTTESWIGDLDANHELILWAIGNVAGPGGTGTIFDVKLSIAFPDTTNPVNITITPITTGGYGGFTDPSTPQNASLMGGLNVHTVPQLSDGTMLPSHGEYGDGISWYQFFLGDFNKTDSPTGDFINTFPNPPAQADGSQINAYRIQITGVDAVHFDLYDHVQAKGKGKGKKQGADPSVFAPFSHDAEGHQTNVVPEPGTLVLLGSGLLGCARYIRRRKTAR